MRINDYVVDRFVTINDIKLHYLDWDNVRAPVVILLHGLSGSAHSWDYLAFSLREQYHCLAIDQRGHGDSQWADIDPNFYESFIDDLSSFVDYLNIDRFTLVGHSMGGRYSMIYAIDHPEKVDKLVIVDIGPEIEKSSLDLVVEKISKRKTEFDSLSDVAEDMRQRDLLAREEIINHVALGFARN